MSPIPSIDRWSGKLPTAPRYFLAAGDDLFFQMFAPALAMSSHKTGNPVHMHCINPSAEALKIAERCNRLGPVSATWCDDPVPASLQGKQLKSYFSNFRLFMWPQMLRRPGTERVVVIDFDSLFNRPHDFAPVQTIGIYRRDDMKGQLNMMCNTSMFWADASEIDYADAVCAYIAGRDLRWQLDQEAVFAVAQALGKLDAACDIAKIPGLLDWEFRLQGVLWTGKGAKKETSPAFVGRVRKMTEAFWGLPEPCQHPHCVDPFARPDPVLGHRCHHCRG